MSDEHDHDHDHAGDEDIHTNELHGEEHHSDGKPWGEVIGASLLVQIITFSGLLLTAFSAICKQNKTGLEHLLKFLLPSFACGALSATAVFLLIPESLKLLESSVNSSEESHDSDTTLVVAENSTAEDAHADEAHDEHDGHEGHDHFLRFLQEDSHEDHAGHGDESYMWMFGVAVLAGFLIPVLISTVFKEGDHAQEMEAHSPLPNTEEQAKGRDEEINEKSETNQGVVKDEDTANFKDSDEETEATNLKKDWSFASSLCIGDMVHNFVDGIFLGNAFLLCGNSVAWTITATTIYHELAQEISDLGLLVNHCGLDLLTALVLNFSSGTSVLLGALLVLSFDFSEKAMGVLLAMSAGVYIHISATECLTRVQKQLTTSSRTAQFVVAFAAGAVPIGLVLLNHGHCEAEHEEEHDH